MALDQANNIAATVWFATYELCVNNAKDLSTIVLDDSLITDDPSNDDGKKCTSDLLDAPACEDKSCSGKSGLCTTVCQRP